MSRLPYRVVDRRRETTDTVTVTLEPTGAGLGGWSPGQLLLAAAPEAAPVPASGPGGVPLSISGGSGARICYTVRDVDAATHAIAAAPAGTVMELSGPYGQGWRTGQAQGRDLLLLAGGIELASLRPLLTQALAERDRYERIAVLIGARTPTELIFTHEYGSWRAAGAQLLVTVDHAGPGWRGSVGLVTALLARARFSAPDTAAFLCGPEVMTRLAARDLDRLGIPPEQVQVALERPMHCGTCACGRCQIGSLMLCRDGPVVDWPEARVLLSGSRG